MSFIQNLFSSRDNNATGNTFVGQQDRIWWNPDTNAFYYSDGVTPGGILITGGGSGNGVPGGSVNNIQFNLDGANFGGTPNLVVTSTGLSSVGNIETGDTIVTDFIADTGSGNIYHTGNLLPSNNTYSLGLPTVPWQDAYFGPQSITVLDASGNIANSVVIENLAANIVISTTGFTINTFGTTDPIFRIETITGQIFSNAETIIANVNNSSNTASGSLQTAGGAGIAKDLYVGGNIYGTGAELSNVVNSLTAAAGISISSSTGDVTIGSTGVLGVRGTTNQISVANVGNVLTLSLPQNFNTTANVQLYSLTVNDLTILGNVSNVTPAVVSGKIVYVANTATNLAGINTSGLVTGNAANGFYAGILYETTSNTWQMDIGNSNGITSDQVYAANITANGTIHLGNAYNNYDFTAALLQGDTNVDTYSQFVLKNHSQTANASADIVAVANNGDDSVNYIDMGINSNVYANVDYAVTGFNDGYLYVNGGNLVIGTQTPAKVINFFTGGTNSTSRIRGTISDSGLSIIGNITGNNMISTNATIGGTVSAAGNVTGGNLIGQNLTPGRIAIVGSGKQVSDNGAFTFTIGAANVLSVAGNVNATNFNGVFYGNVVTTGNITGGNVTVTGVISSTGNVSSAGNVLAAYGIFSGGNTVINAGISTTGNITGSYHLGNGSQLTGVITTILPTALSNTVHIAANTVGNTATIVTDATTANTANTIVVRDGNGSINVNGWVVSARTTGTNYTLTSSDYWVGTSVKNLTITLPNAANGAVNGRQYQISDEVHSGNPGTTIAAQSPATIVGNQPSQQGQIVLATYLNGVWYCN